VKLLRREFVYARGQILIDGQDITSVTWDSLHEAFAEVPQNPSMFHRSVRDNIRYARPDASDDEVIAAAREAHCHAFIAVRPKGYDSIVGEKGMKLSGGERQRVAIARAFLKNAPMLILDEATSSLDSEAEHLIQDGLLRLMEGRTVIAIAHRLSTIMHLDRIVVLENGRIVEDGTHAALLANNGTYARLWNHQAGGFI
jgi:ATP-binding cassette subfamily B protein